MLYAHDGQGAIRGGLEIGDAVDALAASGAIEPHIVVAIDATDNRSLELTPARGAWQRPNADVYGDFVAELVKPLVDARFRTRCGRHSTAVVGYSYGGLASLHIAMRHPETFGRVICMSPSFWWNHRAPVAAFARYRGLLPDRLWIDVGTREGRDRDVVPYMVRDAREVRDLAIRRGMTFGEELGYLEDPGAEHGSAFGAARIRSALAFSLSGSALPPATSLELHVFRPALPGPAGQRSTTIAAETRHGEALRLTWPIDQVGLRVTGAARLGPKGTITAVGSGTARIEARIGGRMAAATVTVSQ